VVITGTVALNGGDAAILEGQHQTLRRAFDPLEIVVFDQQADVARRYHPGIDFRPALFWPRSDGAGPFRIPRWVLRVLRLLGAAVALRMGRRRLAHRLCPTAEDERDLEAYLAADLVTTPGGTMLVEHYQFLPRLVDYAAVLVLGRPLVFFTQSLGPFTRHLRERALAACLRRARLVLVRGEETRSHVLALGVPPHVVRVAPDAAFLLADDDLARADRARPLRPGSPRVAVSLRDWPFFRTRSADVGQAAYERAVGGLCTWLVRTRGAEITCVSTCQGIPEYWADDSRPAARMVDGLPADVRARVQVDGAFRTPLALRDHLARFDLVVATRLHAAILAMTAGTPVLVIGYERKAHEVLGRMDLDQWVVDIEGIDGAGLIEATDRLLAELGPVSEELAKKVARQRELALAVADELRAAVRLGQPAG
jgi:colanic acid/amylovoran biosynthesis protein